MINARQDREHYLGTAVAVVVATAGILLLWTWYSDVVTLWLWQEGW